MEREAEPLVPPWLMNPPRRLLWWALLIGTFCLQVILAFSGRWTVRHSLSLAVLVAAVLVVHPVMNRRLPLFRTDLLKSWRVYVGVALVTIVNFIELQR
jgi:hypothetical protein